MKFSLTLLLVILKLLFIASISYLISHIEEVPFGLIFAMVIVYDTWFDYNWDKMEKRVHD